MAEKNPAPHQASKLIKYINTPWCIPISIGKDAHRRKACTIGKIADTLRWGKYEYNV